VGFRAVGVAAVPNVLCLLLSAVVRIGGVLLVRRAALTPKGVNANAATGGRSNNSQSKTLRGGDIIVGIQYSSLSIRYTFFAVVSLYCEAQPTIDTPQCSLLREFPRYHSIHQINPEIVRHSRWGVKKSRGDW
jgi:hypothetical protein